MKKYNQEHFSVYHKRTGKKIADCGSREDARMLVNMDWQNREYRVNRVLMSEVIDIEIPKSLPTTEIVTVHTVSSKDFDDYIDNLLEPKQIKLPEGKGVPINTK
jgi:hypothetical protein